MTPKQFNSLISRTIANYSSSQGSLLILREQNSDREPVCVCLSSLRNSGTIVPSNCSVSDEDGFIYEGNVRSRKLYNKLKKCTFCYAEITVARDLDKRKGEVYCLGDHETCGNKRCYCKRASYTNPPLEAEEQETLKFNIRCSKRKRAEA